MIRIAICNIDKEKRSILSEYCQRYLEKRCLKYCIFEYESGRDIFENKIPDIMITGIELEQMDAILVKDILAQLKEDTRIIFVSNQIMGIRDAFGKNVYGYINDPPYYEEFCEKFKTVLEDCEDVNRYFFCKQSKDIVRVYAKDILYIEAYGRYSKVYVRNEQTYKLSDKSMGDWLDEIDQTEFASCHRRYIVNLFHVISTKMDVELINGQRLPLGAKHEVLFRNRYQEYVWRKINKC